MQMNSFNLHYRGATEYVAAGQIYANSVEKPPKKRRKPTETHITGEVAGGNERRSYSLNLPASIPQAASMSSPLEARTVVSTPSEVSRS